MKALKQELNESVVNFVNAVKQLANCVNKSQDLSQIAKMIENTWGGRGGDDVEGQIVSVILNKAVWVAKEGGEMDQIASDVEESIDAIEIIG